MMHKETEEILIFAGFGLLILLMLRGGGLNSSVNALKQAQLDAQTNQTYANDAASVLSSIFD